MIPPEKILWQPFSLYQPGNDFGIFLDATFAKKMFDAKIGTKRQIQFEQIAKEIAKQKGYHYPPLVFEEDSALVTQFSIGNNGTWLATERNSLDELLKYNETKPLIYHSHNVDTPKEAYTLLALVDHWIEYSEIITTR